MTDLSEYLGAELHEEDEPAYLQPRKYKIKAKCSRCGKVFSWIANSPGGPDRPCPAPVCVEARINEEAERRAIKLAKMLDERRGPSVIGNSAVVKAVDTTAEIVMQDHGLTDLKDNIREGDSMVPSLKGKGQNGMALQQAADNFFGGGVPKQGINRAVAARMNARVRRALHGQGISPPMKPPGAMEGEQALWKAKEIPNSGFKGT